MEENGITARDANISRTAMAAIIQRYTHEAGLRQLEREIGSICRKVPPGESAKDAKGPSAFRFVTCMSFSVRPRSPRTKY